MKFKDELTEARYGENGTADESYQKNLKQAQDLIKRIDKAIKADAKKQKGDPKNWGYTGSMKNVLDNLESVAEFIGA